ncbi:hypothetical protein SAMN05216559_3578 [Halomicrobium zhouii]|uniref:Uncharacterized protein n=1 Tax=Halomicrobium zhouii TaxID=767519 RepID=A0A1I6M2L4_9EURY|nr:hypothetical protein SAMN05216559_3578 [Halomicrobium zhouii]
MNRSSTRLSMSYFLFKVASGSHTRLLVRYGDVEYSVAHDSLTAADWLFRRRLRRVER